MEDVESLKTEISLEDQPGGVQALASLLLEKEGGGISYAKVCKFQMKHCLFSVEKDHWGDVQA